MAFPILLIYLFLTFIRPFDLNPSLDSLHLMQVFGYLGLILTIAYLPVSRFPVLSSKQLHLMLLFVVMIGISRILARHYFGGAIAALQEFNPTFFVFVILIVNLNNLKRVGWTMGVLVLLALTLVAQVWMAFHYGTLSDLFILAQPTADGDVIYRGRAAGFMSDPNDLAETLVAALPMLSIGWRKQRFIRNVVFVIVPALILLYGVFLTKSRGAVLSLLVIVLLFARKRLGGVLATLFTAGAGLALLVLNFAGGRGFGASDNSARQRLEAWSIGLQALKQHPIVGVGYHYFQDFNQSFGGSSLTAHNSFVICFSELGIFGYIIWMALLVLTHMELSAIQKLPVKSEEDARLHDYARAVQVGFYGFLASAWFLSRTYVVTLYILVGLATALAAIARRRGAVLQSPLYPDLFGKAAGFGVLVIAMVYLSIKFSVR